MAEIHGNSRGPTELSERNAALIDSLLGQGASANFGEHTTLIEVLMSAARKEAEQRLLEAEGGRERAERALMLAAQHCQGGHSEAGRAIADVLGIPFPVNMAALIGKARANGQNPATLYPWLTRAHGVVYGAEKGKHPFFTDDELAAPRNARAALSNGSDHEEDGR